MCNPNPQPGQPQHSKLTYEKMKEQNALNNFNIPGFKGMFQNGIHYKFGKKVFFEKDQSMTKKDA